MNKNQAITPSNTRKIINLIKPGERLNSKFFRGVEEYIFGFL